MSLRKPIKYSTELFEENVLQMEKTTLVCFVEEWSEPCKGMEIVIERLAAALFGLADVCVMDIDTSPLVAASCSIRSIPTLILFKQGREVQKIIGLHTYEDVYRMIQKHIEGLQAL